MSHQKVMQIKNILSDLGEINQVSKESSPYILNMSFKGVRGEILTNLLSSWGVYVSMGTACRSNNKKTSALTEMGFSPERALSAIRLSFSVLNTEEEALQAKEIIKECVAELRGI